MPLHSVALVVQEVGAAQPLFAHDPTRPMNPASVMKLVTTFAALELLGRDYRWKTEAYLGGPLDDGVLRGDLIIKGYGDPKITIEQWQSFMAALRAKGLDRVAGDLALDRTWFKPAKHDPAEFDKEPLKPYNVGPDALLVSFNSVRFVFAPNAAGDAVDVRAEPPLAEIALGAPPGIGSGDCGDWRGALGSEVRQPGGHRLRGVRGKLCRVLRRARLVRGAARPSRISSTACSPPISATPAGCSTAGSGTCTRRRGVAPFATLESPPLYDIVRDVNKLSNNVMARQIFLTLATTRHPPPATPALAADVVQRFLKERKIAMPGLVIENGSGLSRNERVTAGGLAQLLAAADRSSGARGVRELAGRRRDRRHGAETLPERHGGRAGAAQDRHAGGRQGARRLCHRRAEPPLDRRGHHQPSQRRARPGRRWTASCSGSIAAPGHGTPRPSVERGWAYIRAEGPPRDANCAPIGGSERSERGGPITPGMGLLSLNSR